MVSHNYIANAEIKALPISRFGGPAIYLLARLSTWTASQSRQGKFVSRSCLAPFDCYF